MNAAKTKILRAVLYARYSTERQRNASIEDQFRQCERVAAHEGFKIVERYGDKAISGGTADRPAYQAMIKAARAKSFDVIITEDISRLWRNRSEWGPQSAELEDLGVHWLSCVGDDTRREGWSLMIQIKAAMAEHERRAASYRTRRGQEGKAIKGELSVGKTYGYRNVNGGRVIDEQQAEIVREMYKWRASGWSGQRIARQLNVDGVQPPGATWNRTSTGPRRKNTAKTWRPSCIVGDPTRGVGILNNPLYKGLVVWGRSKWTRQARDSNIRVVSQNPEAEWISVKKPELQIVPDDLWNKVRAIQTATNGHRLAIRKALGRKRGEGRGSKYWLGSVLVCGECGANLIGDGRNDYICPTFLHGPGTKCHNDMRFRRDDAHAAAFELLREHLLSDEQIERGRQRMEAHFKELQRQEDQDAKSAESGADFKRLDQEAARLRGLGLRPAALAAGLAEIDAERVQLLAKANGKRERHESRARQLMARMPELVKGYRAQVQRALTVVAKPQHVEDAREAMRCLLVDGRITVTPNETHTAVTGPVHFKSLGDHMLELAGVARQVRTPRKLSGSGGRI